MLTFPWLGQHGISPKLANHYVQSGWLHRVGEGAFSIQKAKPDWVGAVYGLQQRGGSIHPGGRTALEIQGRAHFLPLGTKVRIFLFGRHDEGLPAWFRRLPWAGRVRLARTNFLPPYLGLWEQPVHGLSLRIATPERAALEFVLEETTDAEAYEHARLVFEGLGTLRPDTLQPLLEKCTSVRVKRLFLHLAESHGHPWLKELNLKKVSLGSGKRVFVRGGRLDPKYLITVPATSGIPRDLEGAP